MPVTPKGSVPAPVAANPAPLDTPPAASPTEGALTRSALVDWLTAQAATTEPNDSAQAPPLPDAAPAPEPDQPAPTTASEPEEAETQAKTEADLSQPAESAPEPAESPAEDGADAETTPGVRKRINKMRRELGDAQREIERLHEELAEIRTQKREPAPAPAISGALHANQAKLETERTQLEQALDMIEANPDGLTVGEQTWSAEDLRKERRRLSARLYAVESEQRQFANQMEQQAQALQAEAEKLHPWLKDRTHPDTRLLEGVAAEWPGLARLPGFRAILADALMFRRSLAKAKPANQPARPTPKAPPAAASAPPPPETRQARVAKAAERVRKEGTRESLIEYLQAQG